MRYRIAYYKKDTPGKVAYGPWQFSEKLVSAWADQANKDYPYLHHSVQSEADATE